MRPVLAARSGHDRRSYTTGWDAITPKHKQTQRKRKAKPKTAKRRRHQVTRTDAVVQPKERYLRDDVAAKRVVAKLRALASQEMTRDEMRAAGLDIAIREGLRRQQAVDLVNRFIASARTRPVVVISVGHVGLSRR